MNSRVICEHCDRAYEYNEQAHEMDTCADNLKDDLREAREIADGYGDAMIAAQIFHEKCKQRFGDGTDIDDAVLRTVHYDGFDKAMRALADSVDEDTVKEAAWKLSGS